MSELKMTAEEKKQRERWELESAMSALQRAEEIKRDPKMMKKIQIEAVKKQKELQSIAKSAQAPTKRTVTKKKAKR